MLPNLGKNIITKVAFYVAESKIQVNPLSVWDSLTFHKGKSKNSTYKDNANISTIHSCINKLNLLK